MTFLSLADRSGVRSLLALSIVMQQCVQEILDRKLRAQIAYSWTNPTLSSCVLQYLLNQKLPSSIKKKSGKMTSLEEAEKDTMGLRPPMACVPAWPWSLHGPRPTPRGLCFHYLGLPCSPPGIRARPRLPFRADCQVPSSSRILECTLLPEVVAKLLPEGRKAFIVPDLCP